MLRTAVCRMWRAISPEARNGVLRPCRTDSEAQMVALGFSYAMPRTEFYLIADLIER